VVLDDLPAQLARFTELLNDVPSTMSSWAAIRDTLRSLTRQFTEQDPELTAVRIRLWMTEPLLYALELWNADQRGSSQESRVSHCRETLDGHWPELPCFHGRRYPWKITVIARKVCACPSCISSLK
jgi:hypothetical protein